MSAFGGKADMRGVAPTLGTCHNSCHWRWGARAMKIRNVLAAIAAALFIATGCAAAATIEILQVNNHLAGGNPSPPAGFTLLDFGTGTPNSLQTTSPFTIGGVTF